MSDAIETQGFKLEIGNGDSPLTYTEVKEIKNFNGFDGSASEIDVTHLQSTAKEFRMGIQDNGQFNVDGNFLPGDAGQDLMRAARASREIQDFKITWSDDSTTTFQGFVQGAPRSGGVDAIVEASFTIRISGDITDS
jgi:hypothetical protein